nr:hypothetical protein [Tanacetum cinerariifolium]
MMDGLEFTRMVKLKDLPHHLEYAFLEGDNKFPGIIPEFCTHKILIEKDYKPAVQHQRQVNPKIYDVIKKEVEKLLDAGLIYPISDSPWVSPHAKSILKRFSVSQMLPSVALPPLKMIQLFPLLLLPFGDSDFLLFEEADAFLGLEDDPDSPKINPFYYDPERDILLLEAILNSEPLPLLPNQEQNLPSFKEELKAYEA